MTARRAEKHDQRYLAHRLEKIRRVNTNANHLQVRMRMISIFPQEVALNSLQLSGDPRLSHGKSEEIQALQPGVQAPDAEAGE